MMNLLPMLLVDGYKVGHPFQYPRDTQMVYSNMTPRGSRVPGVDQVVHFGMQYFVREYLIRQFNEQFFRQPREQVMRQYKRRIDNYLGKDHITYTHIGELHELGYLPLHVKAIPEGMLVPMRVPLSTTRSTDEKFYWLTNSIETVMSNVLWQPTTSATTSFQYRRAFDKFAALTGADKDFVKWQGHDFSFRGLAGVEAALLSGAAHLLSFTGTDCVPAIDFLEEYYGANSDVELVGGSVDATEHAVMCVGGEDNEYETILRLVTVVYPKGVLSVVSDTWDLWHVLMNILPRLKEQIMARDGKYVTRPDSGDPVKIMCGDPDAPADHPARRGVVQCKWDVFGGSLNPAGYKVLDPHVGTIYGEAITRDRQDEILGRLMAQGFCSSNVVLGIGSYTFQYVTRDTYGIAVKATYAERTSTGGRAIFKKPKTDVGGVKDSATGLLCVVRGPNGRLQLRENVSWAEEATGVLQSVFINSQTFNTQTLAQLRGRIEAQLCESPPMAV